MSISVSQGVIGVVAIVLEESATKHAEGVDGGCDFGEETVQLVRPMHGDPVLLIAIDGQELFDLSDEWQSTFLSLQRSSIWIQAGDLFEMVVTVEPIS